MKVLYFLLAMAAIAAIHQADAVEYIVENRAVGTPGGNRFDTEIGIPYSEQTLKTATDFIYQNFGNDKQTHDQLIMYVQSFTVDEASDTGPYTFLVSADYIASFTGDVRNEVTGLIYQWATYAWQWNGNGNAPQGLIDGIADYIRLTANFPSLNWADRGAGSRWDEGNEITAYFLEYCSQLQIGFVGILNSLMKDTYSDDFFMKLLGKSVDDLWNDYKSQYQNAK